MSVSTNWGTPASSSTTWTQSQLPRNGYLLDDPVVTMDSSSITLDDATDIGGVVPHSTNWTAG